MSVYFCPAVIRKCKNTSVRTGNIVAVLIRESAVFLHFAFCKVILDLANRFHSSVRFAVFIHTVFTVRKILHLGEGDMTVLISSIGDTFQGKCGAGIHVASFIKGVIGISDLSNGVKQYRMIGNVIPETVYLGPCIILQTGCAAGGIGCIIDGIIKGEGRKAKCTIARRIRDFHSHHNKL